MITIEDNTKKALFAMGCITFLEAIALLMGVDGALLASALGALAAIAGVAGGIEYQRRQ